MGQIADLICKNIVNASTGEDDFAFSGFVEAELAIKKSIAKLGRELIKEIDNSKKEQILYPEVYGGRIWGVQELLRRIKEV